MRQLSLRSPKGADTEGAGGISKAPDRASGGWLNCSRPVSRTFVTMRLAFSAPATLSSANHSRSRISSLRAHGAARISSAPVNIVRGVLRRAIGADEFGNPLIEGPNLRLRIGGVGFPHPGSPDILPRDLPQIEPASSTAAVPPLGLHMPPVIARHQLLRSSRVTPSNDRM